jgi:hypothetical protein
MDSRRGSSGEESNQTALLRAEDAPALRVDNTPAPAPTPPPRRWPSPAALPAARVRRRAAAAPVTKEQIPALVDAAIVRWAADGLDAGTLDRLRGVEVRVAGLGGNLLGQFDGPAITLNDDPVGYGWFVDPTPAANEEFAAVDGFFRAFAGGPADGRMDRLTVLEHELGHAAGLADLDGTSDALMAGTLAAGVRR